MPLSLSAQDTLHVDTAIVGFGKAGKTLAGELARAGRTVALVEQSDEMYGGTCINIGCVPTKTLVHDADLRAAAGDRLAVDDESFYAAAIDRKRTLRQKMNAANLAMVEDPGALVLRARAVFTGERTLRLSAEDESMTLTADQVVIGTGATPRLPAIEGLPEDPLTDPRVLTSTELIDRDRLPRRLAILGVGPIGLELANMYREFGVEVSILDRGERLLRRDDEDTSAAVESVLTGIGVDVRHRTTIDSVTAPEENSAPLTLHLRESGSTGAKGATGGTGATGEESDLEVDALLLAIGRVPATAGLGLDAAGIATEGPDGTGAITVDAFLRTSAPEVWAVGDVNGGPQFTFVSFDDHRIVRDQLLGGKGESGRSTGNRGPVPSTTFITPPFSRVGLSAAQAHEQARERGWDVAVARKDVADIAAMPRPKAVGDPRGFLQVVVDRGSEQILGATLLCTDSQEIINLLTTAMKHGLPFTALRDAIFTHPSSTEGLNEVLGTI